MTQNLVEAPKGEKENTPHSPYVYFTRINRTNKLNIIECTCM